MIIQSYKAFICKKYRTENVFVVESDGRLSQKNLLSNDEDWHPDCDPPVPVEIIVRIPETAKEETEVG